MNNDLKDLYQEVILDHNKSPHHFYKMTNASCEAEGYNPLCGDHLHVYVKLHDNLIDEVSFQGDGCAIFKASSSMMTDVLKGKTITEAEKFFTEFHAMVTGKNADTASLGKLAVFEGVSEFPSRVKCASLAWHTLRSALNGDKKIVTTE